jgi:hypothetical protein
MRIHGLRSKVIATVALLGCNPLASDSTIVSGGGGSPSGGSPSGGAGAGGEGNGIAGGAGGSAGGSVLDAGAEPVDAAGGAAPDASTGCPGTCLSDAPDWAHDYENARIVDMAVHDGSVILVGTFENTSSFGGAVFTAPGELNFAEDMFVVKLASDGSHVWSRQFGGPEPEIAGAVALDPAGNVYVTGSITDTVDFGGGPIVTGDQFSTEGSNGGDVFLLKLSPDGQHIFSAAWGGDGVNFEDDGEAISIGVAGEVYLGGRFQEVINFGGDELSANSSFGSFLVRFGPSLSHDWSLVGPFSFAPRAAGGVVMSNVGGVSALDAGGVEVWSASSTGIIMRNVATAVDGRACVTGSIEAGASFDLGDGNARVSPGFAVFLVCYEDSPTPVLAKTFAAPLNTYVQHMSLQANGTLWLRAYTPAALDLGGGALSEGAVLAAFARDGSHVYSANLDASSFAVSSTGLVIANDTGRVEHRTFE